MAVFGSYFRSLLVCVYDGRITRLHFNGMFGYKDAIDLPFILQHTYTYILHPLFSWLSFSHSPPFGSLGPNFFLSVKHINVKCNQFDGLIFHIGISSLCEIFTSYSLFYDLHHKHFIRSLFAHILMVSFRHFICALQHFARIITYTSLEKTPFQTVRKSFSCFCCCVYRSLRCLFSLTDV